MNLHSIWDGGFIDRTLQVNKWTELQYTQKLLDGINSQKLNIAAMQNGDYISWAAESYNLAVTNGYGKLPEKDDDCKIKYKDGKGNDKTSDGCYRLDKDYYDANNAVVENQLKSGGVRLAKLLNSTLGR